MIANGAGSSTEKRNWRSEPITRSTGDFTSEARLAGDQKSSKATSRASVA